MSNTFPFVVGQNFGPFVNNDNWNLVRSRFDKLMMLGCIFFRDVSLVSDPSFFVFCQFFDKLFGYLVFVLYCEILSKFSLVSLTYRKIVKIQNKLESLTNEISRKKIQPNIINLPKRHLTKFQILLLTKGPKVWPTTTGHVFGIKCQKIKTEREILES